MLDRADRRAHRHDRVSGRYHHIRSTLRSHAWRPVDGVWSVNERGRAANILLRDPTTGEQAALRTPSVIRPDQDVRLTFWFAGDLRRAGVVTTTGGGQLSYVHRHRTAPGRHHAVRTPQWLDAHNWPRPAHALRQTYEIFDLEKLREDGYVPPTEGAAVP